MAGVAEHSFEICAAGQSQTASFMQLEAYARLLESLTCEIDESLSTVDNTSWQTMI